MMKELVNVGQWHSERSGERQNETTAESEQHCTVGSHEELIILEEQRAESDRLFLAMRYME
jgi:hypothetical protein